MPVTAVQSGRQAGSNSHAPEVLKLNKLRVFIGSSSEALTVAEHFAAGLEAKHGANIEATVWNQGIFGASQMTLHSLVTAAKQSDFAVLVLSADDVVNSRELVGKAAPRDNVIFELGLFMGAISLERVFILPPREGVKLPSDLGGFTLLSAYVEREDKNVRASLNAGMLDALTQINKLGARETNEHTPPSTTQRVAGQSVEQRRSAEKAARGGSSTLTATSPGLDAKRLEAEIGYICRAAEAQGWQVKTRNDEVLRLLDRQKTKHTFPIPESAKAARSELRTFARTLRANGLRVSSRVREDV